MVFIQEMIAPDAGYSRYFAFTPEMERWGLGITAAGRARIPAGTTYPDKSHPEDHLFDWNRGRTLDALQVVLITDGMGWFESAACGCREIRSGMLFLILPGSWHRHRPDPATGWTESWVEVRGPVVDSLVGGGVFPPSDVILEGAIAGDIEPRIDAVHRLLLHETQSGTPAGSAAALQVLAACEALRRNRPTPSRIRDAVTRAERHLAQHHAEDLNLENLARDLGMAYSHFRRAFREQTGLPPWRYVIQLRLARARRLLASGEATLDDIAARVGFSSAFHLSHAFKQAFGIAPDPWRRRLARGFGGAPDGEGVAGAIPVQEECGLRQMTIL